MSKERRGPVASCVKQTLERFFHDLNGEKVTGVYDMILHEMEKPMLEIVMRHTKGNQVRAANVLGINRNTLRKKLKQHKVKVLED